MKCAHSCIKLNVSYLVLYFYHISSYQAISEHGSANCFSFLHTCPEALAALRASPGPSV